MGISQPTQWELIARLWSELMDFPSAEIEATTLHMVRRVRDLVGAPDAFFVMSTRKRIVDARGDALNGWRPRVHHTLGAPDNETALRARWYAHTSNIVADPHTIAMTRGAGRHRAYLRRDVVDDETWDRCPQVNELLRPCGVIDRVVSAFSVRPDVEVYVGLSRRRGDRMFDDRDRDVLRACNEGLGWLHRRLAWSHGVVAAEGQLTPRERAALQLLLRGLAEKDVARALGVSDASAHQYVVAIYRKLGVTSRAELLARWPDGGAMDPRVGLPHVAPTDQ